MKTYFKILFPLMAILFVFSNCKKKKDCDEQIFDVTIEQEGAKVLKADVDGPTAAVHYEWSNGVAGLSQIVVDSTGRYSVTVTDISGCSTSTYYDYTKSGCPTSYSCLNGGTCVNGTCQCPEGFTGDSCQLACRGCTYCGADTTITDIEGNTYKVVSIGGQCWMAKNLRVIAGIPEEADSSAWITTTSPAWCFYDNNFFNNATYGKLYNGYAVQTANLCPAGWHIPTLAEWDILIAHLGGEAIAGGAMKDTAHWTAPNTGATNSSGFSARPGGTRNYAAPFINFGTHAFFWTSTEEPIGSNSLRIIVLSYDGTTVLRQNSGETQGMSCRCVKD